MRLPVRKRTLPRYEPTLKAILTRQPVRAARLDPVAVRCDIARQFRAVANRARAAAIATETDLDCAFS
jgi:hypothetical protein